MVLYLPLRKHDIVLLRGADLVVFFRPQYDGLLDVPSVSLYARNVHPQLDKFVTHQAHARLKGIDLDQLAARANVVRAVVSGLHHAVLVLALAK